MLDAQNAPAAPAAIRREDYRPPDWLVPSIELEFDLGAERTRGRSILQVERSESAPGHVLSFNADGREPDYVSILGEDRTDWRMEGGDLLIQLHLDSHTIEIVTF